MLSRLAFGLALLATPALADGITKSVVTSGGVTITHSTANPLPTCPGNVCPGDINIVFPTVVGCTNPKNPKTGRYYMDCTNAKMVGGTSQKAARGSFSMMDKGGNVTFTPD